MFHSLASVIGGLGLFFAGVWFLTENLKRLTGRRFRHAVVDWTRKPAMGFGWGVLAGAVTQSMSVTVFILVSLLSAGLIAVETVLPIIVGANLGASVLVIVASLEIEVVMLYVIGIAGIAMTIEKAMRFRVVIGAIFGFGMLFLGIAMIQKGAGAVVDQPWAASFMASTGKSYAFGFLVGAGLTFLAQSSAAISILAITLADAGVFGVDQTIMCIYGANFGSSAITLALSWSLHGGPKQVAMYQVVFNAVGCLILVPLFYLEVYAGVPLVKALAVTMASDIDTQLACVYLIFNASAAVAMLCLLKPSAALLERIWPPTPDEDASKPRFLRDQALQDPPFAADLVLLEQRRLIGFLARYLHAMRAPLPGTDNPDPKGDTPKMGGAVAATAKLHAPFESLSLQINEFIGELGARSPTPETSRRLDLLVMNQHAIHSVEATLMEMAEAIKAIPHDASLCLLADTVFETQTKALEMVDDVLSEEAAFDGRYLETVIYERSEILKEMRDSCLSQNTSLDPAAKSTLFTILHLSERFFWLLAGLRIEVAWRAGA